MGETSLHLSFICWAIPGQTEMCGESSVGYAICKNTKIRMVSSTGPWARRPAKALDLHGDKLEGVPAHPKTSDSNAVTSTLPVPSLGAYWWNPGVETVG